MQQLLPARAKIAPPVHFSAIAYPALPAFMVDLRATPGAAARALEFTIMTAARVNEALGAQWGELDLAAKVWTVPASRMKAGRAHAVPLSGPAVALLESLPRDGGDKVFRASDTGLRRLLRAMGSTVTVHRFRSSFRDWAGNETTFPRELAEQSLAHVIGDKAEQAYRRGDALERRRALMSAWARFCSEPPRPAQGDKVVDIASARAS